MAEFTQFLDSFDPDSTAKGKQFEHFVKRFLKKDPQWSTQVDKIWLWNDWPGQWGPDCGIDLVFQRNFLKLEPLIRWSWIWQAGLTGICYGTTLIFE